MTEIIADACRNHFGCKELIEKMILNATVQGADYIKFQLYNSARLNKHFYDERDIIEYQRHQLSDDQVQLILRTCKFAGITPMFTIFTKDRLEFYKNLFKDDDVCIKVASPDMNPDFVGEIKKFFWDRDIFVSTGMHTVKEITEIRNNTYLEDCIFLYCISKYPTFMEDVDFEYMQTFNGFSDHTQGIEAAKKAIDLGMGYVEKHFTLSHNLPGKDKVVSIDPEELYKLCVYRDSVCNQEKYKERWKW